ncbi:TdeIII family type II restriction endonuclease [Methanotorris igneus]|uniref:type II site-specific deoxyribonuclease n=1 Tax=Methanotorris igneus (strain DSM 5666 / JCM 11834 / Kol 5) TaxID=880724 RepID=F6BBH8_METIK|nr:TdeIII family type II restriction endonuclease [Methanotorris igneus]AEF97185.1 Type II site-specific deoxyribonuclease [Methanotorris igneus Kol 5]
MLPEDKIEEIAIETIRVLVNRFRSLPDENSELRNMPFHLAFLKAFYKKIDIKNEDEAIRFLTLSSWFHGLSTTLGQSYFENVAHILSDGEKRTFNNYSIPKSAKMIIEDIITDLKSGSRKPNMKEEEKMLRRALFEKGNTNELERGLNFTADVYIETKEEVIMIELKSVRPNAGEMRGEKQKILYGKAYLMYQFPKKKVRYYLGFPFDPTSNNDPCGYDKERFASYLIEFSKYFDKDEFLIAGELWDFLSGEKDTMCEILKIINDIATPKFEEEFKIVNRFCFINEDALYTENAIDVKKFEKYIEILNKWKLYSEIELAKIVSKIGIKEIPNPYRKQFEKLINLSMFDDTGRYNKKRKEKLMGLYDKLEIS